MASQDWFDKDFYKILGVSKDVPEAELKKVYRKLAASITRTPTRVMPRRKPSSRKSPRHIRF